MALSWREFEKALAALEEAIAFASSYEKTDPHSKEFKIARDATIQRYEFCVELAWKVSLKFLGVATISAKPAIREMLQNKLIDDADLWFDFIEARNKSSHTYREEIAVEVYEALQKFVEPAQKLLSKLKAEEI